jgi:hypothetical protein
MDSARPQRVPLLAIGARVLVVHPAPDVFEPDDPHTLCLTMRYAKAGRPLERERRLLRQPLR